MDSTERPQDLLSRIQPLLPERQSALPAPSGGLFDSPNHGHLYCPHCDYDLTGAPTNRCPECGNEFDREELVTQLRYRGQPLPVKGALRLAWMSLFDPCRLGREMPVSPRVSDATGYAFGIRLLIIVVTTIGLPLTLEGAGWVTFGLGVGVIAATCSYLCEVVTASVLSILVHPRVDSSRLDGMFWRTLTACFSTHLLISFGLLLLGLGILLRFRIHLDVAVVWLLMGTLAVATLGWWSWCLGRAVSARTLPTSCRMLALILIPSIGLIAIGLGFALLRELDATIPRYHG